jgi:hypothetical protein
MEPEFGRSLASGINMFLRTQSHKKERTLVGQDIKILDLVTATAPCDPTRWSPASLPHFGDAFLDAALAALRTCCIPFPLR